MINRSFNPYYKDDKDMDTKTGKSEILVVDDEKSIRVTLKEFLEDEGFMVTTADCFEQAMQILAERDFDVAVIDRILSNGHSGIEIIEHINTAKPLCQKILMTAYPTFELAQVLRKNSCCDYLIKPVAHGDICFAVKKASQKSIQKRLEKAAYALSQT